MSVNPPCDIFRQSFCRLKRKARRIGRRTNHAAGTGPRWRVRGAHHIGCDPIASCNGPVDLRGLMLLGPSACYDHAHLCCAPEMIPDADPSAMLFAGSHRLAGDGLVLAQLPGKWGAGTRAACGVLAVEPRCTPFCKPPFAPHADRCPSSRTHAPRLLPCLPRRLRSG